MPLSMPRKRQQSQTTNDRFELKSYRTFLGGLNTVEGSRLAAAAAHSTSAARSDGASEYHQMRETLRSRLASANVPSGLWALAMAFGSELIKNAKRGVLLPTSALADKYTKLGLPSDAVSTVQDAIGASYALESTPVAARKA